MERKRQDFSQLSDAQIQEMIYSLDRSRQKAILVKSTIGTSDFPRRKKDNSEYSQFNLNEKLGSTIINNAIRVGGVIQALTTKALPRIEEDLEKAHHEVENRDTQSLVQARVDKLRSLKEKGFLLTDKALEMAEQRLTDIAGKPLEELTPIYSFPLQEVKTGRDVMITFPNGKSLYFKEGDQLNVIRAMSKKPLTRVEFQSYLSQTRKDLSSNVSTYVAHMRKRLTTIEYTVESFQDEEDPSIYYFKFADLPKEREKAESRNQKTINKEQEEIEDSIITFSDGATITVDSDEVTLGLQQFVGKNGMVPNFEFGKRLFGDLNDENSKKARRLVFKINRTIADSGWRIMNDEPSGSEPLWELRKVILAKQIEEYMSELSLEKAINNEQKTAENEQETIIIEHEALENKQETTINGQETSERKQSAVEAKKEEPKEAKVLSIEKRIPSIRDEVRNNITTHFTTNLTTYSVGQLRSIFKISIRSMRYLQENDYVKPVQRGSGWEDHPAYTPEEVVAVATLIKHYRRMNTQMVKQLENIIKEEMKIAEEKRNEVEIEILPDGTIFAK